MLPNNNIATPRIIRVPDLPFGEKANYAIQNVKNSAEEIKKYLTVETAEYYLGIIELLLSARFLVEFFRGYSTSFLTKAFIASTTPLVFPFSAVLGSRFSSGLAMSEVNGLLSMASWAAIVWTGIAVVKYKARHHTAALQQ